MSTLDKDRLSFIIGLLENARKTGFSTLSSPVDILLETFIDLCLLLRDSFREGSKERQKNPGLKFLETRQDELGNPKQIKVFTPVKYYWSPEISKIFENLASFAVLVKQQKPPREAFMASLKGIVDFTPPKVIRRSTTKKKNIARKQKNTANQAYFRRRQRRLTNQ